ncbi:MAG: DEAD/DEAH box helicase [Deltaproteobacteria bacterium]|nr:DEAD/DEAH box helicase [Deltaproteobacteria bacterium]
MPDGSPSVAPERRAEKPDFLTSTRFDGFDLPARVLSNINDAGFVYCTTIQEQSLPVSLAGHDVAGQAQTGTGKTAAFLVTIITRFLSQPDMPRDLPSALIIAPTRELSHQIYEEARILFRDTDFRLLEVVGGIDYQRQADALQRGADIIICTPGRIIDYYKQGIFKTEGIQTLVIDEADRLFDLGFTRDMRYLLRQLPPYEKRQSMLFSATLSYRVLELTYEYMNLPEFISVTPDQITVEGIDQSLFHVGRNKKLSLLLGLLTRETWSRMLIFVNTKVGVEWLTHKLKGNGWPAEGITGDLPQRKRFRLMERFKSGRIKILIATDVASRGIHVEDISHVVNYDLPQDSENYVHRIGRTARAGKSGRALSLACEEYVFHLEPLENMLDYKIPVVWPEDDWFVEDKAKPFNLNKTARGKRSSQRRGRKDNKKRPGRPVPGSKTSAPKKKARTLPGAFFGFGPDPQKEKDEKKPRKPPAAPKKRKKPVCRKGKKAESETKASKPSE